MKKILDIFLMVLFVVGCRAWRSSIYPSNWEPTTPDLVQDFSYAGKLLYFRKAVLMTHSKEPISILATPTAVSCHHFSPPIRPNQGYHMTGLDLPQANQSEEVAQFLVTSNGADPTGTSDATAAIQLTVDQACNETECALAEGCRRVVYFPPGTYRISNSGKAEVIKVGCGNIILRGAGTDQTFLFHDSYMLRGASVISAGNTSWNYSSEISSSDTLGAKTGQVASAAIIPNFPIGSKIVQTVPQAGHGFAVGDWVVIQQMMTKEWLSDNKLNGLGWSPDGDWIIAPSLRQIVAARLIHDRFGERQELELDIPLRYPITVFNETGDSGIRGYEAFVTKVRPPLSEIGIEKFSIGNLANPDDGPQTDQSTVTPGTAAYNASQSSALSLVGAMNSWIRNVSTYRPLANAPKPYNVLGNGIVLDQCARVTVTNCFVSDPQFPVGANGFAISVSAQDSLIHEVHAHHMRQGFVVVGTWATGNVITHFHDSNPVLVSDFHSQLSVSNLVEVVKLNNSGVWATFRPVSYPAQGPTTSLSVLWNIVGTRTATRAMVNSHQFGMGYVVGTKCCGLYCKGTHPSTVLTGSQTFVYNNNTYDTSPEDFVEGVDLALTLEPQSLYFDQLSRRLAAALPQSPTPAPTQQPAPTATPWPPLVAPTATPLANATAEQSAENEHFQYGTHPLWFRLFFACGSAIFMLLLLKRCYTSWRHTQRIKRARQARRAFLMSQIANIRQPADTSEPPQTPTIPENPEIQEEQTISPFRKKFKNVFAANFLAFRHRRMDDERDDEHHGDDGGLEMSTVHPSAFENENENEKFEGIAVVDSIGSIASSDDAGASVYPNRQP